MRRRFVAILVAISLLLCVATVVLWARSRFVRDRFSRNTNSAWVCVESLGGAVIVTRNTRLYWRFDSGERLAPNQLTTTGRTKDSPWSWMRDAPIVATTNAEPNLVGFGFNRSEFSIRGSHAYAVYREEWFRVPYWSIAVLLGVLPVIHIRRTKSRQKIQTGKCAACSYDMRATPGQCPECGATPILEAA